MADTDSVTEKMAPVEITVHDRQRATRVAQMADTIWITVPLAGDSKIVIFLEPEHAAAIAQQLGPMADRALRVAEINAEAVGSQR